MRVGFKVVLIGVIMLLLMIPMLMLGGRVQERQMRAAEVRAEIAASSSRSQRVAGPLLILDIERQEEITRSVLEDGVRHEVRETRPRRESRLLLPDTLQIDNRLISERRGRSLFQTVLFHNRMSIDAAFELPDLEAGDTRLLSARLAIGLGDNRGLRSVELDIGERQLEAAPGTGLPWLGAGIQAELPTPLLQASKLRLNAMLELTGTDSLQWLPLGRETVINASGDWPHPGFRGDVLPAAPSIDDSGFEASWRVSHLSSTAQQAALDCGTEAGSCHALDSAAFGVRLVDPVDRYLMTERAIKYSLLVLLLVFGTVFFIEVLQRRSLHPLQYALTGLALGMFFLLLLSLSEHIGFAAAYAVAALACLSLIASYMAGVLGSRRAGWRCAGLLALLYLMLYGLLQSEDYALLMGSLALFVCLAVAMLTTRRLDWSRLQAPRGPVASG